MKTYKNYSIPEVKDLNSQSPQSAFSAHLPNIFCKRDDGLVLNTVVTMEDISMMSEEKANELIFKYACQVIDTYENEISKISGSTEADIKSDAEKASDKSVFTTTKKDLEDGQKKYEEMKAAGEIGDELMSNDTQDENKLADEEFSEKDIQDMMKRAREVVQIMETNWTATRNEFKLTDNNMKELYQWNEQHRVPPAEGSNEEDNSYDRFNGIDMITEEEVLRIFGEGHPIIGVDFEGVTKVRVKDAIEDFFNWLASMKEFRMIHNAYMQYIEAKEERDIEYLKLCASKEEDPDKKAAMEKSIKDYYYQKNLDFIPKELTEKEIEILVNSYSDGKKLSYWMKRTEDKLKSMKLSPQFILEISQLEIRFLPEKYHQMSNVFLEWFMHYVTFSDVTNPKSKERTRIAAIVFALDSVIQNRCTDEFRTNVLYNITEFLDMLIEPMTKRHFSKKEEGEENVKHET